MIEFHDIVLSDKEKACKALRYSDFMGCEYCFSSNLAWSRLAGTKCAFYKYFYIYGAFETEDNIPRFFFPAGKGDYKEVISLKQKPNPISKKEHSEKTV